MIKKNGYFVNVGFLVDEQIWLALTTYANQRNITPDLAIEQFVEDSC